MKKDFVKTVTIKQLTWVVLVVLLFVALIRGAEISNNVLALSLMLLLLALFTDLKEFDFWGLKGKKNIANFKELKGKVITGSQGHVTTKEVTEAEKEQQLGLMDTVRGNFLALSFEIERLLRIYGNVALNRKIPNTMQPERLTKELERKDYLTREGVKQLEALRYLKNMLIEGREDEVTEQRIKEATQVAKNIYSELYSWLYQESR